MSLKHLCLKKKDLLYNHVNAAYRLITTFKLITESKN